MNLGNLTPGTGTPPWEEARHHLVRNKCNISPYQLTHFQVGTGASGVTETSAVVSLGSPLSDSEYGDHLRSVDITSGMLYLEEDIPFAEQDFITVKNQGVLGASSLVSVIFLDEETANGQTIDEVGLFVDNPFMVLESRPTLGNLGHANPNQLGGGQEVGIRAVGTPSNEAPGHFLAAYRHIKPIVKKDYFALMIRWSINFSIPRV